MRAFAVLALALTACVPFGPFGGTSVDYADFVRWNGIDYQNGFAPVGRSIADADLGPEYFRVKQMLSKSALGPGHLVEDGDAAFVPAGSPVFTVRGYAPTFRLAARRDDGTLVLYEARTNPAARVGADLLDVEGRVRSIALLDAKTGRTVVARIADPARVDELVRLVLAGRVDLGAPPTAAPRATASRATAPADRARDATPDIRPVATSVVLAFELKDGTASVRGFDLTASRIQPNVAVDGAFRDAIVALVASAPTPTPVPATVDLALRYDLAHARRVSVKRADRAPTSDAGVAGFAAALDAAMPASHAERPGAGDAVIIFEFADHYVSLVYDRAAGTLTVAVPDDKLSVRVTDALRALLP